MNLYINDEFFEVPWENKNIKKTLSAPNIVYEGENILIVFKPIGIVVHHGAEKPVKKKNNENICSILDFS